MSADKGPLVIIPRLWEETGLARAQIIKTRSWRINLRCQWIKGNPLKCIASGKDDDPGPENDSFYQQILLEVKEPRQDGQRVTIVKACDAGDEADDDDEDTTAQTQTQDHKPATVQEKM